jgi:hypothetical protein
MANKPIIKVDVDSSQFKEFYALYQEYEERLSHAPEEWKKIDDVAGETHAKFAAAAGLMSDAMLNATRYARELSESMRDAIDAQKELGDESERSESKMKGIAKHAKEVSESIFGIGKFLMKTTGWGAGLFAGATFGMNKLAESAVGNQRSALGLGMTTGQYRSFNTDLGQYVDPSMLNSVSENKGNLLGRMWLSRATGLSQDQVLNTDPGTLAAQMALKAHDWWASTPSSMHTVDYLRTKGFLESGMTFEGVQLAGNTNRSLLQGGLDNYRKDSAILDIGASTTNKMYDFMRQVTVAGQSLETVLTKKLADLGPHLGNLITGIEKDAELLLNNIFTEKNVNAIASGIDTFTKYLGSQEFRDAVQKFLDAVKVLGNAAIKAAGWLKPDTDAPTDGSGSDVASNQLERYSNADIGQNPQDYHLETLPTGAKIWALNDAAKARDAQMKQAANASGGQYSGFMRQMEQKYGIDGYILSDLATVESTNSPKITSPKGAQGLMQLMPGVSKALGVADPFDWKQNVEGGAKLWKQLQDRYHGDIKKELAAWNWNPKSLDADIQANGADWDKHLPKETQGFIAKMIATGTARQQAMQKMKIEIQVTNKSGTNVAVSANAAAI